MAWIYLIIAGMLETVWAVSLKYTEGWTRLWPSLFTGITMVGSFYLLSLALRTLPVGTAYAIWTGIGAVGAAVFGIVFLGEARDVARILSILLIVAGIVGLKIFSGPGH
jgi:quaternary ammonium compound-resistance protein SugE